jgi:hypothetical protein
MSVLEQKIEMYEWLTLLKDKEMVRQLHDLMRRFVQETSNSNLSDIESKMSLEHQNNLHLAIQRSEDLTNYVSNDEAEKVFSQWIEN